VIIDIHTHAFTDALAARAVGDLEQRSGISPRFGGTVAGLRAEARRAGVDVCVVQPVATKPTQVRTINDWAAATQTPDLLFFSAMHPDFEDPATELARAKELGLHGVKLHTEYQFFKPDEPRMAPIYEAAIEQGLPILFHAGEDEFTPTLYGACESFARMLERWPGMTAILAHMGGYKQWEAVRGCILGLPCYLDTSYSMGHMPDVVFLDMVNAHGAERVLFGSDEPWDDAARELEVLRRLPLTPEQRGLIEGESARRLLGL
jgi:predicted TIM-barrel fold metal-dependent hydrolase